MACDVVRHSPEPLVHFVPSCNRCVRGIENWKWSWEVKGRAGWDAFCYATWKSFTPSGKCENRGLISVGHSVGRSIRDKEDVAYTTGKANTCDNSNEPWACTQRTVSLCGKCQEDVQEAAFLREACCRLAILLYSPPRSAWECPMRSPVTGPDHCQALPALPLGLHSPDTYYLPPNTHFLSHFVVLYETSGCPSLRRSEKGGALCIKGTKRRAPRQR